MNPSHARRPGRHRQRTADLPTTTDGACTRCSHDRCQLNPETPRRRPTDTPHPRRRHQRTPAISPNRRTPDRQLRADAAPCSPTPQQPRDPRAAKPTRRNQQQPRQHHRAPPNDHGIARPDQPHDPDHYPSPQPGYAEPPRRGALLARDRPPRAGPQRHETRYVTLAQADTARHPATSARDDTRARPIRSW